MMQIKKKPGTIEFEFLSDPNLAFRVIEECRQFFLYDIPNSVFIELSILLREMLMNAIQHGNKSSINRKVWCRIVHLCQNRFKITVEDQGDGFDYRKINRKIPDHPEEIKARGYILIHALSDRVEFNTRGNRITIYYNHEERRTKNEHNGNDQ